MPHLAIIMTGQIRTFFSNSYFTDVLNRCIQKYDKILVICVLNSSLSTDFDSLHAYFSSFKLHEVILINYTDQIYQDEYNRKMNQKYNSDVFIQIRNIYMNLNNSAHSEIFDPITCLDSIRFQFHQISIGIQKLIEYQNQNNIYFDITFKTRFDIMYPDDFYPHVPKGELIDILSFNDINKQLMVGTMQKYQLDTLWDLILFNKNNKVLLPNCRVSSYEHLPITFGGTYLYNYKSLEYILSGNTNIIYSFNDHFQFGETKNMIVFEKLFDEFWEIFSSYEHLNHYFSPEVQIMVFCLHHNIPILFYFNHSFSYIR
jgi:hypothetical protein